MSQTHFGYTSWKNPPENIMPDIKDYSPSDDAELGRMVEGTLEEGDGTLPQSIMEIYTIITGFCKHRLESCTAG